MKYYALVAIGSLFCFVGCGPRTGEVSGEVLYKGKPVPGGFLTFRPADNAENSLTYTLEKDGKFKIVLPVGDVRVCLDNREFEPQPATTPAIPPGLKLPPDVLKSMAEGSKESNKFADRWMKIPKKYYELESSDLSFTVKGGEQTESLVLKD
jgi:hypothetical protein